MNPMIRKELRQRMRERRTWVLPSLYLAALGGAVTFGYYFMTHDPFGFGQWREQQGAEIGVVVFFTVVYTQMALLLLMAPIFSAGSITIEKEQRTLAGLLTSLLTPAEICWGKFVAALLFLTLLLFSALPVLGLSFALGGIGPREVARAAGITLLVLAAISAVGLYCSSYFRRSVHATAVTYALVIALTLLTYVARQILYWHWAGSFGNLRAESQIPRYVTAPLYLNPFYALTGVFAGKEKDLPHWGISLLLFAGLGILATALALRNLKRGGEHV